MTTDIPEGSSETFSLGIDLGSTTVKYVLLSPDGSVLAHAYQRHASAVTPTLISLLQDLVRAYPHLSTRVRLTGSGALSLSERLGIGFVQEVIAAAQYLQNAAAEDTEGHPVDAAIELGGEDAKILYLTGSQELRMNEACAGGTGAFLDQMSAALGLPLDELNCLAGKAATSHPIASRCGVFAKTDVVGLLNSGIPKSEIARSVFDAVAEQAVGGLSCGRPLRGRVALLGGPLSFMSELRAAFARRLARNSVKLELFADAQYAVAHGAALESSTRGAHADKRLWTLENLIDAVGREAVNLDKRTGPKPLFDNEDERRAFLDRHAKARIPTIDLSQASGDLFLGIDLGSTTAKGVLITSDGEICCTWYEGNQGAPLQQLMPRVKKLTESLPAAARIRSVLTTGYGADLAAAALGSSMTEVETLAHQKAASSFIPGVTFVIDIGGQDMKCLQVENGLITSVALNEACSSGCGAFLESFSKQLGLTLPEFVQAGLRSEHPVDLGSRCTVFMNSKVREAQRDGASSEDIAAGLCISVVRNALEKVLRISSPEDLGDKVVVQGGTFLNDGVLRAFEKYTGLQVIRPQLSGLMGAYGAALLARERTNEQTPVWEPSAELFDTSDIVKREFRCRGCSNSCALTLHRFASGNKFVSGNRCEFGLKSLGSGKKKHKGFVDWKIERLFSGEVLPFESAPMGEIGIMRVLNTWEHYPYWHALFTELGFRVVLSDPTTAAIMAKGSDTVPSQSLCLPAKIAHGHALSLAEKGVRNIWFPCIPKEEKLIAEAEDSYACPVVGGYPEALRLALETAAPKTRILTPFVSIEKFSTVARALCEAFPQLKHKDVVRACEKASAALKAYRQDIKAKALEIWNAPGFVVVLAGHPYHLDSYIHHGIPTLIESMGAHVLTEDAVSFIAQDLPGKRDTLDVVNQWAFHGRLYRSFEAIASRPDTELVQLVSFGCGIDAITSEQMKRIAHKNKLLYTMLKIDETDTLGAARIRLRSLFAVHGVEVAPQSIDELPDFVEPKIHVKESPIRFFSRFFKPAPTEAEQLATAQQRGQSLTAQQLRERTLYVPQMAPIHFPLLVHVLKDFGYTMKLLPTVSDHAVTLGLRYVNNDACYPAIVTIGQLLEATEAEDFVPEKSAILFSQTCGPCRATNYPTLLDWALRDKGFPNLPVLTLSGRALTGHAHLKLGLKGLKRLSMAIVLGDVLQRLYLHAQAGEIVKGSADIALKLATPTAAKAAATGKLEEFDDAVREIVNVFNAVELDGKQRPKVGIVGEILLQYHPKANLATVDRLREAGAEPMLPDLATFFLYCLADPIWQSQHTEGSKLRAIVSSFLLGYLEKLRSVAQAAMGEGNPLGHMPPLNAYLKRVEGMVSPGQQAGEGWLLAAEMAEFLATGTDNVVCLQPFGCLPNHITGRGVMSALRARYPKANLIGIDFEGGTAESNVSNRLKLFMTRAHQLKASGKLHVVPKDANTNRTNQEGFEPQKHSA